MSQALVVIQSRADREKLKAWIEKVPNGTRVELRKPRRSLPANSLLWSLLTSIAEQVDWYGQKLTPTEYKDLFTAALRQFRVVPGINPGTFVPLGMRTSTMTKEEFSDLLALVIAFGAERGVKFHDDARAA